MCSIAWHELERRLKTHSEVDDLIEQNTLLEAEKWKKLQTRIINVVLLLGERGLPFRGSSQRIGDVNNGNFLAFLELLADYDFLIQDHITKVQVSQQRGG